MSVFIDTSGFYAVMNRDEQRHEVAGDVWRSLAQGDQPLLTTNYVVLECFALIQARLGMRPVQAFHDELLPVVSVQWTSAADHEIGKRAFLTAGRRKLSLVDCVSFQIMHRLGLREVFTFDRHFEEHGFRVLPSGQ